MNRYIPIETPGGTIWAEIEETPGSEGIELTGWGTKALKSFEDTVDALKKNAQYLLNAIQELGPEEVEVSFGIKVGAEAGTPFFGLAKASGEGSYTITYKWKSKEP